jgi:hypothetical protein
MLLWSNKEVTVVPAECLTHPEDELKAYKTKFLLWKELAAECHFAEIDLPWLTLQKVKDMHKM